MAITKTDSIASLVSAGLATYTKAVTGGVLHIATTKDGNVSQVFAPTTASAGVVTLAAGVNTSITTNGAGTLTAAAIAGGLITRTGNTAAVTDTTDTGTAIEAAVTGCVTGTSFEFSYKNDTAFAITLAGGTGVTLSGQVIVPKHSAARFLAVCTGANTFTIYNLTVNRTGGLPAHALTTLNATTGSLAAGKITGADSVVMVSSNATPGAQLVRSAANMLADTPNGKIGMVWKLRICNSGAGTLTLTADGGTTVTLSGTMTVATGTFRDFICSIDTSTTATITAVGQGTYT